MTNRSIDKRLVLVTDTAIIPTGSVIYAFHSVVKELNKIEDLFDEIVWIGYNYTGEAPDGMFLPVKMEKCRIVLLPRTGGKTWRSKFRSFILLPLYIHWLTKEIKYADVVHVRGPSLAMLAALLLSFFYSKGRIWWFKYASNFLDPQKPLMAKIQQKLLLSNKKIKVTINGKFRNGSFRHLLSFENPCLEGDLISSNARQKGRTKGPAKILYVGNIAAQKGIRILMQAGKEFTAESIGCMTFIGEGEDTKYILKEIEEHNYGFEIRLLGALGQSEVFREMQQHDFLCLPSLSEGFPKVVAEAWFNGCLPIVSDVSCVGDYVKDGYNGFLWNPSGSLSFSSTIKRAISLNAHEYKTMQEHGFMLCALFTYERFRQRLVNEILNRR